MMAHPFHIHDVQFYILDRDGLPPAPEESGRKDVVLVNRMETVRFITQFTDFADSLTPYMYHCHILMHEDDGMMGQFVVVPDPASVTDINETNGMSVFPSPASGLITFTSLNEELQRISVYDLSGRKIFGENISGYKFEKDISSLFPGIYSAVVVTSKGSRALKFIRN